MILISQLEYLMYCDFTIYSVDLLLISYCLIINTYYILRTSLYLSSDKYKSN